MTVILFEGADKVGKTTLADMTAHLLGTHVNHFSTPGDGTTPFELKSRYQSTLFGTEPPVVVDRAHWSEWAYGNIYRGKSLLDWDTVKELDTWLWQSAGVIVHCVGASADRFDTYNDYGNADSNLRVEGMMLQLACVSPAKVIRRQFQPVGLLTPSRREASRIIEEVRRYEDERKVRD